jgi:hypothetical protein
LELLGVEVSAASNRINPEKRKFPCPLEKRLAIVAALYKVGRVQAAQTTLLTSGQ